MAVYMAGARDLRLDPVGGGEHDWNHLFYQFSLLSQGSVATISGLTRVVGILVVLIGLAWVGFFLLPPTLGFASAIRGVPWSETLFGE